MLLARTSTDDDASKMATQRAEPEANNVRMLETFVACNSGTNRILHGWLLRFAMGCMDQADGQVETDSFSAFPHTRRIIPPLLQRKTSFSISLASSYCRKHMLPIRMPCCSGARIKDQWNTVPSITLPIRKGMPCCSGARTKDHNNTVPSIALPIRKGCPAVVVLGQKITQYCTKYRTAYKKGMPCCSGVRQKINNTVPSIALPRKECYQASVCALPIILRSIKSSTVPSIACHTKEGVLPGSVCAILRSITIILYQVSHCLGRSVTRTLSVLLCYYSEVYQK